MPFAYFDRLDAAGKRTYRKSDGIRRIEIPDMEPMVSLARAIAPILESGERGAVGATAGATGPPPDRTSRTSS